MRLLPVSRTAYRLGHLFAWAFGFIALFGIGCALLWPSLLTGETSFLLYHSALVLSAIGTWLSGVYCVSMDPTLNKHRYDWLAILALTLSLGAIAFFLLRGPVEGDR